MTAHELKKEKRIQEIIQKIDALGLELVKELAKKSKFTHSVAIGV